MVEQHERRRFLPGARLSFGGRRMAPILRSQGGDGRSAVCSAGNAILVQMRDFGCKSGANGAGNGVTWG